MLFQQVVESGPGDPGHRAGFFNTPTGQPDQGIQVLGFIQKPEILQAGKSGFIRPEPVFNALFQGALFLPCLFPGENH